MKPQLFNLAQGKAIQANQLAAWKRKLNASCYCDLLEEVRKQNATLNQNSCGYDVWRGCDMDSFVANWQRDVTIKETQAIIRILEAGNKMPCPASLPAPKHTKTI